MTQTNEERFTDINPNDLSPELQVIYKRLQADYTRKTQGVAEERKTLDETVKSTREQLSAQTEQLKSASEYIGMLEDTNQRWVQYNTSIQDKLKLAEELSTDPEVRARLSQARETQGQPNPRGTSMNQPGQTPGSNGFNINEIPEIQEIMSKVKSYEDTIKSLNDRTSKLDKKLSFSHQLNDLYRTKAPHGFKIDQDRILKRAIDMGTDDLNRAFEEEYKEDILEQTLTERLKDKEKEWEEKHRTNVLDGGGNSQDRAYYIRKEGVPTSYEEAEHLSRQDILAGVDAD